jgi:predicted nuclease of predicted toxin-antitoxin system
LSRLAALRLLADESCDFRVVTALRGAGHDVFAVVEQRSGAADDAVLDLARRESRIILAEDKDFGRLVVAAETEGSQGVLLMRCSETARPGLPAAIVDLVSRLGDRLAGAIVVWTPSGIRYRRL